MNLVESYKLFLLDYLFDMNKPFLELNSVLFAYKRVY
jgi:hypothetical protein